MNRKRRILTGITTTGTPHLGNYVGAIRPAIAASRKADAESFYFLADYHALVKCDDPSRIQQSTLEIAASWLACGLDPEKVYFYRQSDIPEIPELTWLLTCVTAKGLLNRAHAYKATNDANREKGEDPDAGVTAGLYMYPVLMAADILIFNANQVPVGRDQIQHIEMARDIGQRFNHIYGGDYFTLPEAAIEDNVATLPGLDGRKMSKSYNNTIPLFEGGEKALRTTIMSMVTDSSRPQKLEDARGSALYQIIEAFAGPLHSQVARAFHGSDPSLKGWGTLKTHAIEAINHEIGEFREKYERFLSSPGEIEEILQSGAKRARALAQPFVANLREVVGLRSLLRASTAKAKKKDKSIPRFRIVGPYPVNPENPATSSWGARIEEARISRLQFFETEEREKIGATLKRLREKDPAALDFYLVRREPDGFWEVRLRMDGYDVASGWGFPAEDRDAAEDAISELRQGLSEILST